jgi:hypothetical protein
MIGTNNTVFPITLDKKNKRIRERERERERENAKK